MCGEKEIIRRYGDEDGGSPPRVRGEETAMQAVSLLLRITPACAGRSAATLAAGLRDEDHPRVCGEKPTRRRRLPAL